MTDMADGPRSIIDRWVADGTVKGVSLLVMRHGEPVLKHHAGLAKFSEVEEPVTDDTLFMIASITKTLTAACFMQYVENGLICLSEPVSDYIPEFRQNDKARITFRHLLTHTSGLPEQVEGKDELRAGGGGMEVFMKRIYGVKPLFPPGEGFQYSNCGFALLAKFMEMQEGKRFGEIMDQRIYKPLRMNNSAIGFDESWDHRVAEISLPAGQEYERGFLNTRYWRALGASWGAMISTTGDLARFALCFLRGGELDGVRILSRPTVSLMTRDRLCALHNFPRSAYPDPHGLAWRIRGNGAGGFFGDLTSPSAFGHTGATGTFLWADPESGLIAVLLCNKEQGSEPLRFARLSNVIVRSFAQ